MSLAFVGVDTGEGPATRRLGVWETFSYEGRVVWFLPVAKIDPGDQRRWIPHSLKLAAGVARYVRRLPSSPMVQAHRMDLALLALMARRRRLVYMIHTQQGGLTGKTSDSFWRFAKRLHENLEKVVVKRAEDVLIFNEEYSSTVREWNRAARFSPTWWDPALIDADGNREDESICWVGRLETPKDPALALAVVQELHEQYPTGNWSLKMLGSGTLFDVLKSKLAELPDDIRSRIHLFGRVEPAQVAHTMSRCQVFLMTSHPGYEGYPRVLVEALASGLPAVVTEGSDTGRIVKNGVNGFVTNRNPATIAAALVKAVHLAPTDARRTVEHLAAPAVVRNVMAPEVVG